MSYLPGGGYAEYVAVEEVLVMPAPDSLELSDAAAIPEAWLTAYQQLFKDSSWILDAVLMTMKSLYVCF